MSSKLQPVRGTHDMLPHEAHAYQRVVMSARDAAARYGFAEVQTPIFEFSEVFHRTLGDTSDVVTKETYTFTDRGGESITLRPEFTASIVRMLISEGLTQDLPQKFFYSGPAFRYERPQKGRMRQFHQIGVELLGASEPQADAEIITLAYDTLAGLGLANSVTLELNTLGDAESRSAYRTALVDYFTQHRAELSEDSRTRLERNPLRILDSKDENDRRLIEDAPQMEQYFTDTARAFFAQVRAGLEALSIPYTLNPRLVRGLDYYQHTVFEFTTTQLGAQGTVLAGGRYDGLVKLMGGPDVPGVGFAAGVERLMALTENAWPETIRPVALIPVGEAAEAACWTLAHSLRREGIAVELAYKGNVKKRMQRADKIGASHAIIIGEEELASQTAQVKNLATGEQQPVPCRELARLFQS